MMGTRVLLFSLLQLVLLVASQSVVVTRTPRIDTHCHFVPPFYAELLNSRNIAPGGFPLPSWNVSAHLAVNAMVGTVKSVVSVSTPGAKFCPDDPVEEGRLLARRLNEYGKNLTIEYPEDFLFFATLTLPDVEGSVAEAIYALDTLDAAGVILQASTFGEQLGVPRYAPLYKVLNDRKAVVFIHPSSSACPSESIASANARGQLPSFAVDFLLDTTRAALNLVYRNVTTDYPDITFILSHSGGFVSFAAVRAAASLVVSSFGGPSIMATDLGTTIQKHYLQEFTKFTVDLAISANPYALPSTMAFFDTTHIIWGSDFPFAPVPVPNALGLQNYRLSESADFKINYGNAYGLLEKFLQKKTSEEPNQCII